MTKRLVAACVVAAGVLGSPFPAAGASPSQTPAAPLQEYEHRHDGPLGEKLRHVETQLRCNCGCSLDVHLCQFQMQCGTSPGWSQRILRELRAGAGEEAILAGFVSDFGGTVLMSPPAEGFNWLGYLLPPMAILAGGVLVGLFLRREPAGAGRTRVEQDASDLTAADWARLEGEMRRLDDEWEDAW